MSTSKELNQKTVSTAGAQLPNYDREQVTTGIVHLGTGVFHRAHQAVYLDDILKSDPSWGIVGASLRSAKTANALNKQDGLYTVRENGPDGTSNRIIGSISNVIPAGEDRRPLLDQMSEPSIRIVTLTVTEKGYCHDPASGALNRDHPDIIHDLENPSNPRSTPAILVEALCRRRDAGCDPFTILCCDNLPQNGAVTRQVVCDFARLLNPDLADWIEDKVTFPSTMVDRIAPATTQADCDACARDIGLIDSVPVVTEPFSQWIIEDNFCAARPDFESVGIQMVNNVHPYEEMKLRMLNASHSALAYLSYLAGIESIAAATANDDLTTYIRGMMRDEISPTLTMPGETDLDGYREALIERFQNPGLHHRTWQIAMDGSQKLPQRFLGTIRNRLSQGKPFNKLALGVAAWMKYVSAIDEAGNEIDVRDPMAAQIRSITDQHAANPAQLVASLLDIESIFEPSLSSNSKFASAVTAGLKTINENGALHAVKIYNTNS